MSQKINFPLEENILITKAEYYRLCEKDIMLRCLDNFGVDNWEGYDLAKAEYLKILEEDDNNRPIK